MDDSATQLLTPSPSHPHTPDCPSTRSLDTPSPTLSAPPPPQDSVSVGKIASQEPSGASQVEQLSDRSRRSECESQQEWPQIRSIVRKIGKLQSNLANERKLYRELSKRSKASEARLKIYEEEAAKSRLRDEEIAKMQAQIELHVQKEGELMVRVGELEELVGLKEEELADRQAVLAEVQVGNLKRLAEMEDRQRKLNNDNKELADRIRKANAELEKEKKLNRELKSEMSGRLEQMQANKDTYLLQEIEELKAVIDRSKGERELQLEGDVEALNKRVYQLQEEIRRKDIQLNLMQRKKQQAVAEVQEKKDQESKLQKTVFKTLSDKYNKLSEEVKVLKQQNQEILRTNRLTRYFEEEITLELSPERY